MLRPLVVIRNNLNSVCIGRFQTSLLVCLHRSEWVYIVAKTLKRYRSSIYPAIVKHCYSSVYENHKLVAMPFGKRYWDVAAKNITVARHMFVIVALN